MPRMSKVKHELALNQWQGLIEQQVSSGKSIKQWCIDNGISRDQFHYWQSLVRQRSVSQLPAEVKNSLPEIESHENLSFKKLEITPPMPNYQPAVIIHLPSATIEVNSGTDKQTVEAVLLALKSVC